MNKNKLSFNDFTFIDLKQVHSIILHSWKMFFLIILFSIFTGYFSVQTFFQSTITTYTIKNGVLLKETSTRQFQKSGDYHDSFYSDPLVQIKDE